MTVGSEHQIRVNRVFKRGRRAIWRSDTFTTTILSKRDVLTAIIVEDEDDFTGATTFRHKDSKLGTEFSAVFIEDDDGELQLWLRFKYVADDWVFFQRCTVKIADEQFDVDAPRSSDLKYEEVLSGGLVMEAFPLKIEGEHAELVNSLRDEGASEVAIRFQGRQHRSDHEVTPGELARLRQTIDAFEARGGRIPE